ncbi:unnamed protein product, partial [Ectocarpus sp. 12 AP-2014]
MKKSNGYIKLFLLGLFLITSAISNSQDAVHNFGNLQFHETAAVGFHIDVIDDGVFDQNSGLTGFYGTNRMTISGTSNPVFEDLEVVVQNGLFLETWVGI